MSNTKKAYFAGGCFWGVEYHFQKVAGVVCTTVGYMGGALENPSYEEVSSHVTGHVEVLEVEFDKEKVNFETLAKLFFEIHNPAQLNRQGPDIGNQYRSVIFYTNSEQKEIAEKLIILLREKGYKVVTQIEPKTTFWPAEEYHQKYYQKKKSLPYCHIFTKRF